MGYTDWDQVVCTCGWTSPKVENYNNYKYTMLLEFEGQHLDAIRRENSNDRLNTNT